ncbi:MAG: hypothetical protein KC420_16205 [Myxococcales bacterium]|nr:hypothetical protein [Myxococcales bacterium]MCA9689549.1 hypothetical protein [Myxococcales bacterium]
MLNAFRQTSRTLLALTALSVAALGSSGCDEAGAQGEGAVALRVGSGVGGITFNTSNWVSAGARDIYEFDRTGAWRTNAYGFEVKLKNVTFVDPQLGKITTNPASNPSPFTTRVEITSAENLEVTVFPPLGAPTRSFAGADIVGLELLFNVKYAGSTTYQTKLRVTDHNLDVAGGDLFELTKLNPANDGLIGPICEVSTLGDRFARVYGNISVDAITGAVVEPPDIFHMACTAGAPGKSSTFGYLPHGAPETFRLANRVIRADYCADGYPYTFPGNSLVMRDNFSPGQEGQSLAQVTAYAQAHELVLEAMWDENGVLCVDTPRVDTLDASDVICPVKRNLDGTNAYNWQPPACAGFVDPNPQSLRFYSLTAI